MRFDFSLAEGWGVHSVLSLRTCDSMRYLFLLALIAYMLSACVPANTPNELAALASVRQTQETGAYATQSAALPITQSANERSLSDSYTQTAIPPQQTTIAITQDAAMLIATIESDNATRQRAANVLVYSQTVASATQVASDSQTRIAQNNRAIADSVYYGQLLRDVALWVSGIILFGLSVLTAWAALQGGMVAVAWRKSTVKRIEQSTALIIYRENEREANPGDEKKMVLTSAGPMVLQLTTIAQTRAEGHSRSNHWRNALKTYIVSCVELQRGGNEQPFSRPTCLTHALITRPDSDKAWQEGHKRVVGLLKTLGVLVESTQGSKVELTCDLQSALRLIDTSPLPELPADPIPRARIVVAGWQDTQVLAG